MTECGCLLPCTRIDAGGGTTEERAAAGLVTLTDDQTVHRLQVNYAHQQMQFTRANYTDGEIKLQVFTCTHFQIILSIWYSLVILHI